MKVTQTALDNELRAKYIKNFMAICRELGEEVMQTGSNTFTFPVVDSIGGEKWIEVVIKVPKGGRADRVGYNGYKAHQDYLFDLEQKKVKAEKAAEKRKK